VGLFRLVCGLWEQHPVVKFFSQIVRCEKSHIDKRNALNLMPEFHFSPEFTARCRNCHVIAIASALVEISCGQSLILDSHRLLEIEEDSISLFFIEGACALSSQNRKILDVLNGKTVTPPPIWLMRQAGRYLPEYRETRQQAGSFLDLCYNPELATEVTLQPIRRYGFDAAILFSDILVIPDALKRNVRFTEGHGPQMDPIDESGIAQLKADDVASHLIPVIETVRRLRHELPAETTLLGFCGAPWTVATYMIAGHGTPDQAPARLFAYRYPEAFARLLDFLADVSADYLVAQIDAGADAVQIFDSWAGVLGEAEFEKYAVRPVRRMIDSIKARRPSAKIIAFAKGAGILLKTYRQSTGADAIGLDWSVPLSFAVDLQKDGPVQGNLDPMRVVAGGPALKEGIDAVMQALGNGPLIFNLGHGITPQADPAHVTDLVNQVRRFA
jgi:uroporphyrinogen decarboxylase